MLNPFKNLLTYLQRNANSSTIFGLTTTMGPTEQPRLEETLIASEDMGTMDDGDPLYDPLALDDCGAGADANVSGGGSFISVEDGGIATGEIILVDMTTLKPKAIGDDEIETDDEDDDEPSGPEKVIAITTTESTFDSSSEALQTVVVVDVESVASFVSNGAVDANGSIVIDSDQSNECTVLDSSGGTELDIVTVSSCASPTTLEGAVPELPPDHVRETVVNGDHYAAADVVEIQDDKEPTEEDDEEEEEAVSTADQIQGANGGEEEEEEEASDGSDSGLGLEPSRNACGSGSSPIGRQQPPIKSSLKRRSEATNAVQEETENGVSSQKRIKKGITFDGVTVYYFPRIQGFGCVPSQGGCTLGMEFQHVHSRRLTLSEHSAEQRKVHRQQLQELNPRSSSSEDTSSDDEPSESGSEAESESYGFLQPVSTRQRRALLKAAGVRKIDSSEKDECREIRTSREVCGCTCRGFCDPNRCACSLAGIKCQVDRANFPCGCTHEGCANTAGRVEFNPSRVRTHFMHTIMRLSIDGSSNVIDSRHPLLAGGGGVSVPSVLAGTVGVANGSEMTATDCSSSSSGYVMSSEKNWSNGPVRLLPPGVVYGAAGMHAGTSGIGTGDMADGMHHHHHHAHSLQQFVSSLPNHGPVPFGHPDDGLNVNPTTLQSRHHQPVASSYLGDENYLVPPPSKGSHPSDLHYPFRNYYGPHEMGSSDTQLGTGMGQDPSCTGSADPSTEMHQMRMYYDAGSYPSFAGESTCTVGAGVMVDPYLRPEQSTEPLLPSAVSSADTTASAAGSVGGQHMPATGHDRSNCFVEHLHHPPPSLPDDGPVNAVNESSMLMPRVPPTTDAVDPMVGSHDDTTSVFTCHKTEPTALSLPSADDGSDRVLESADTTTISRSNDTMVSIDLDTSAEDEVLIVEFDTAENPCTTPVDDEFATTEQTAVAPEASSFIDLTAPQADNTERLEAINDLLNSSRHNIKNLVRCSIVAEEDDELRDFQHSPVPVVYVEDDEDMVGDSAEGSQVVNASDNMAEECLNISDPDEGPDDTANATGEALVDVEQPQQQQQEDTSLQCTEVGEVTASRSDETRFTNGTVPDTDRRSSDACSDVLPVSSPRSPVVSGSVEPNENLCEIIKNSIVETAVTH